MKRAGNKRSHTWAMFAGVSGRSSRTYENLTKLTSYILAENLRKLRIQTNTSGGMQRVWNTLICAPRKKIYG